MKPLTWTEIEEGMTVLIPARVFCKFEGPTDSLIEVEVESQVDFGDSPPEYFYLTPVQIYKKEEAQERDE